MGSVKSRINWKSCLAIIMLASSLLIFTTGCSSDAAEAGKYVAGSYTGESNGMSKIEVTLTVGSNEITDAKIVGDGETPGIGGKEAIDNGTFTNQILSAQSSEIDGISGATLTSEGVKKATEDALAQATK